MWLAAVAKFRWRAAVFGRWRAMFAWRARMIAWRRAKIPWRRAKIPWPRRNDCADPSELRRARGEHSNSPRKDRAPRSNGSASRRSGFEDNGNRSCVFHGLPWCRLMKVKGEPIAPDPRDEGVSVLGRYLLAHALHGFLTVSIPMPRIRAISPSVLPSAIHPPTCCSHKVKDGARPDSSTTAEEIPGGYGIAIAGPSVVADSFARAALLPCFTAPSLAICRRERYPQKWGGG